MMTILATLLIITMPSLLCAFVLQAVLPGLAFVQLFGISTAAFMLIVMGVSVGMMGRTGNVYIVNDKHLKDIYNGQE